MAATIVLETGAGTDPTANSYVTLAECTDYHEEMGNAAWAAASASPDTARITAIIRASRAIDRIYGKQFIGAPANYQTQSMQWPRVRALVVMDDRPALQYGVEYGMLGQLLPSNLIPAEVKKAVYEAALVELNEAGSMTPALDRGGQVKSVAAGSVSVVFADGATTSTKYTAIEGILRPLLHGAGTDIVLG